MSTVTSGEGSPAARAPDPGSTPGSGSGALGRTAYAWVSWARILAIVAVLAIHVSSYLVLAWAKVPAPLWHFGNLMQSASRWCVPVFVMISGALLLRGRPGDSAVRFWRRRVARIGVPLVVWTVFYLWFDATQTGADLSAYYFAQGFAWGRPYYHLYFLYIIAGLYLLTPFLRAFVAGSSPRMRAAAAGVVLVLVSVNDLQHWWMGGGGSNAITYFVPWIGYYLLGLVLAEVSLDGRRQRIARWSGAAFVGSVLATYAGTWLLFAQFGAQKGRLLYGYGLPLTVVAAGALVLFLRAVVPDPVESSTGDTDATTRGVALNRWAARLAALTFGIYLVHPVPLQLLRAADPDTGAGEPARMFVRGDQPVFGSPWLDMAFHLGLVLALLVSCGVVVAVVRRIPLLRRLVA